MYKTIHIAGLLGILCLTGCASQQQQSVVSAPEVIQRPKPAVTKFQPADDVLFRAIGLVGTPYVWGGNTPASGFDCSGLIGFVYQDIAGIRLPRTTQQMIKMKGTQVPRSQLKSGDIVFFSTAGHGRVSHAGIYVGGGRFVQAPSSGGTVRLDSVNSTYWNKAYLQAKRVISRETLASNP